MICRLFKTIEFWILNFLVFKNAVFRLEGTLEHPSFLVLCATVKFYTQPNDVLGIFSCHNNHSDLCPFLGQAEWHATGLGSQTIPQK